MPFGLLQMAVGQKLRYTSEHSKSLLKTTLAALACKGPPKTSKNYPSFWPTAKSLPFWPTETFPSKTCPAAVWPQGVSIQVTLRSAARKRAATEASSGLKPRSKPPGGDGFYEHGCLKTIFPKQSE